MHQPPSPRYPRIRRWHFEYVLVLTDFDNRVSNRGSGTSTIPTRRLDRAERIIFAWDARLSERVEKGRFADVWEADDAAFETHGCTLLTSGTRDLSGRCVENGKEVAILHHALFCPKLRNCDLAVLCLEVVGDAATG